MKKLGDRYNHLDTKAALSPDNEERLSCIQKTLNEPD